VSDPSIFVTFPLKGEEDVKLLVWTTTLPSNLAVAVHPDFEYVKIKDLARDQIFVMAKCRLNDFYKSKDKS
jgi:isoleucyl-tRNA synthetase